MMTPSNISTNEGSRLRSSQVKDCSSALPDFPRFADVSMASDKGTNYQSIVIKKTHKSCNTVQSLELEGTESFQL